MDIGQINIGKGNRATVGKVAGWRDLFCDGANEIFHGYYWRVVRARYRDADSALYAAALAVKNTYNEVLYLRLSGGKVFYFVSGNTVIPGHNSARTDACGVGCYTR